MKNSSVPRLLTVREFAERIGVSVTTVKAWARHRKVSTVRFGRPCKGRRIQIPESELARLVSEGTVPAVSPVPRVAEGEA